MRHVDAQAAEAMTFYTIERQLKQQRHSFSDFGRSSSSPVTYSLSGRRESCKNKLFACLLVCPRTVQKTLIEE